MHKKYSKFLIVSFVGVCILGVYSYFYNDLKSEAAIDEDSSLSSSINTTNTASVVADSGTRASEDTAFLMKLASLTRIKIDTSLFASQAFKSLVDNDIKLEPAPYGRKNPFSPTENSILVDKFEPSLKTTNASSITNKSAVLNGSLENATSNNIYFEYGTTETLGKVTPKTTPSLVGSFSSNLNLLTPKTTYYYRSVANINGLLSFGEIMTFDTN
ncbi:MAG: hypothetical protein UR85_C0004G0025 [Candidatus Nomurabacteria bacterium GW2011_GWF2_35_66]|uniref:Fibronectin type-III domain-containing protein n=1 Tax=Candidatus Nomurabacteria bacterium GW2011_GWE1_35_16 TaxID=1618761 RepID=A0A0G0DUU8_9BACT|nr:MAG: hypothetical protein UR55_C0002G0024 [Candidatus Nomurabacteria bacterium GW2011_GWF1_34_20]KKP63603.1 MAG: hypothetical protein UR57_C0002G0024 [Candidatus Nomurabacteria bacterium GW2011_GWE2_34_25]KKP66805.1 MAG: hypothetical protein UR64_C0002G0021 [Candidatus Nomurabacteria bacterium GW2011_GWE1_35_16]KKP83431.1 MAG: hypothetical protein UR85_C0004G0025 [Candidatus Nomurabacteria bacterium GW2011_GWF2_35_66]HAE36637.1 hypothetical protein [Candidatus Nomurabacteria bacterium]